MQRVIGLGLAMLSTFACASAIADPSANLRIGHFRNKEGSVGAIIEKQDKGARIKLDGTKDFVSLDRGSVLTDRTDYMRTANYVMLQLYNDGHAVVFLKDAPDGIKLERDGNVDASGKVTLIETEKPAGSVTPSKDQPPDVKVKLGHYANAKRGIGLVVDRTAREARIRFDGSKDLFKLDPSPGPGGRTDYKKNAHTVLLQVWDDGRVTVYVPGGNDEGIDVKRDGDADPL